MSKGIGLSVAAGIASGVVYLSVLAGGALGILLTYLTPLPLVMVGLAFGLRRLTLASAVALAVVAVASTQAAPIFAVVGPLPVLVLVRQSLLWRRADNGTVEWYPPGMLLAWLGVIAVGLMLLGAALVPSGEGGIEGLVRLQVATFLDEAAPMVPAEVKDSATALWAAMFPAMVGSAWLVMAALNGVMGQWTVAKAGFALRPTPAYTRLELPLWLLAMLVATAVIGATASGDAGYLGRNAAVVLLWPYVFAGLAVVHRTVRGKPNAGMLLALFYVAFFAMFGWALVAVAGLGLVRHWTRLRRHGAGGGQEEK